MQSTRYLRSTVPWLAAGVGVGVAAYLSYVGTAWFRYGQEKPAARDETDALLDQFMPDYEVAERRTRTDVLSVNRRCTPALILRD